MPEREKLTRLLEYFSKITEIRSRPVRNIDNYEQVLWLKDIPQNAPKGHCFTRAWEWETDDGADNTNEGIDNDDNWIQIKKWREPPMPKIPTELVDWADKETLGSDTTIPKLLQSINVEENNPEWGENNPEWLRDEIPERIIRTKYLRDHPEIRGAWDDWISNEWTPWSELHKKWKSVHKVHAKLFSIYQMQLQLGEEYELVLGIGLLQWNINGYSCKRHTLVANVRIDFNSEKGEFVIAPMEPVTNETIISSELDMLKPENQPTSQIMERAEKFNNLWERSDIRPFLKAIANTLGEGDGEYQDDNLEISNLHERSSKPLIDFAPALILRKRNTKRIKEIINRINEQVQQNGNIPQLFSALSGEQNGDARQDNPFQDDTAKNTINYPDNGMAYFPLPSNNEQDKILQLAKFNQGVLVQGPPGTGKSHAVANLICHFLATGKRILITAKTPRALKVLKDKLPDSIKPLCINLLDKDDRQSLEDSVQGILNNPYKDTDELQIEIEQVSEKLDGLKRRQAELKHEIRDKRESESTKRTIDDTYHGTLADIAKRVNKEEEKYNWFTDNPLDTTDESCPFQTNKLINLWQNLEEITEQERQELALAVPRENEEIFPVAQEFSALVKEAQQNNEDFETEDLYQILLDANDTKATKNIIEKINQLNRDIENIRTPSTDIEPILSDILSGENEKWEYLFDKLPDEEKIKELKEKSDLFENIDFEFPDNIKRKKLLADAQNRNNHFKNGGKRWLWLQVVRETRYIEKSVKIDSQECKSQESLEKVIDYLKLQQEISGYWSLLEGTLSQGIVNQAETRLSLQIIKIKEWHKKLEKILELRAVRETANDAVEQFVCEVPETDNNAVTKFGGIGEIAWHDEEAVSKLLAVCRHYISEKAKQKINNIQEHLENLIERENSCHSLTKDLYEAIIKRDAEQYDRKLNEINNFINEQSRVKELIDELNNIKRKYPSLAIMIEEKREEDIKEKIYQIENAWKWARAKSWLENYYEQDSRTLERELKEKTGAIQRQIEKLASLKAWASFSERRTSELDEHLIGWQQEIKKVGRGTGRSAPYHRRVAQQHLSYCLDAIPAWIMPLYRVYQTVEIEPEIFDLIIVDEASQCDLESFLLTYMGKQLIIVGDDQQISPQSVGIPVDAVHRLIKQYLDDFEHADLFYPNNSLFDYGRRKFSQQTVTLREHFRCMPEIIRFSNNLCYVANPLIPLRQYLPERLKPLKPIFVREGYREGAGTKIYNKPEAEKIVDKIVECCSDPQYEGKTIGVIALQGSAQAKEIENLLLNRLDAEQIENRGLICGNAYSFQGDERDIIFLSMVVDANTPTRALTTEDYKRRFNVAASRAKDQMWLAHSIQSNDLSPRCFRWKLLEHFYNTQDSRDYGLGDTLENLERKAHEANRMIEEPPEPYDSWFELDVALMIARKDYQIIPQHPVAGYKIDLVIGNGQSLLAVECDGDYWHGPEQYDKDMHRQRQLERCDWYFYRVKEWMFYANRERVWEELERELQARNINPIGAVVENNLDTEYHTQQRTDNALYSMIKKQKQPFNFSMVDIPPGTILKFKDDDEITCEVVDYKKVKFRGTVTSPSASAQIVLREKGSQGTTARGTIWWCYEGKTLDELRAQKEQRELQARNINPRNINPIGAVVENNLDTEYHTQQRTDNAPYSIRRKKTPFNFSMVDIPPGTILKFKDNEEIICEVFDYKQVKFRNEITSLSASACIVLREMGSECTTTRGTSWWCYEGKTLAEVREQKEQRELQARNINPIDAVAEDNPNAEHHTQQTTDNSTANENNTNRARIDNFNFTMLGIPSGTILQFKDNEEITCEVFNYNKVEFRGRVTSLSDSARTVLQEMGRESTNPRGSSWWCYEGRTLDELRAQREQNED